MRSLSLKPIQKACKEDEGIINAVIEEERELDKRQCTNRLKFVDTSLEKRPHSVDYNNVAFCDEYHFGLGPEITHRIKRKRGRYYRYLPQNVHRKAATRKDKKEKAREKEHFKLFSIFVVIGKNQRLFIPYQVPNKVGKINTKAYTQQILPKLLNKFKEEGIVLCQDTDSAHKSEAIIKWAKDNGLELITLPGCSPDFSIIESLAHTIKRKFHSIRCETEEAMAQFKKIWEEEVDQKMIQHMYSCYTKRFHDCRRANGQMTQY